jgi:hypothetical protein
MTTIKGSRLYVYVSASQARRRLAGYGFGVRKIRSNGRNQAEIIHTATGQHLRELQQLFRDALCDEPEQLPAHLPTPKSPAPAAARDAL